MNWDAGHVWISLVALLIPAAGCLGLHRWWQRRHDALCRELARVSEDIAQLVELQGQAYARFSHAIDEIEGRILDFAAPSAESPLPLQRRHQVLTLARKGVSTDEIARRLNMPKGEAELILSLRKYAEAKTNEEPAPGGLRAYARA